MLRHGSAITIPNDKIINYRHNLIQSQRERERERQRESAFVGDGWRDVGKMFSQGTGPVEPVGPVDQ